MKYFNSNSIYQLLLFLLLTKKEERKGYIIGDEFEGRIKKNLTNVIEVGNDSFIFEYNNKIEFIYKYIKNLKKLNYIFKTKLTHIKNSEIYGATLFSPLFYDNNNKIYLLEDGLGNYIGNSRLNFKQKLLDILHHVFLRAPATFSLEKEFFIEKLYLSGEYKVSKDLLIKTEFININKLWKLKSLDEKNEILRIFNVDKKELSILKSKKIILLTQPLSEMNWVSEDEKIKIYNDILSTYMSNDIIIKTHPREKTDYKKAFPSIYVFDNPIPLELLLLLDFQFELAITLFSSAVMKFKNTKIVWKGTSVNYKLKKIIGDIPYPKK